jgi:protein transport protein SEC24
MPPRSRYAVDPSLSAQPVQQGYQQQQQQPYPVVNQNPQLHQVSDRRSPAPTGPYAPSEASHYQQQSHQTQQTQQHVPNQPQHPSFAPPVNHIPAPPHSSGPALTGPRVRIDPSQMPNPIEAQEMDQNLWDDEDFMSCQTKGVIPLAGTDWRGVDQGEFHVWTGPAWIEVISRQLLTEAYASHFTCNSIKLSTLGYDRTSVWSGHSTFCSAAI